MVHFEKIERIRKSNHLTVTEFLERTNIPKTSYYELKNGTKEFLTHRMAKRISSAFREYKYDWLMNDGNKFISNLNTDNLKIFDPFDNSVDNIKLKLENIEQELSRINLLKELLEKMLETKTKIDEIEKNKRILNTENNVG